MSEQNPLDELEGNPLSEESADGETFENEGVGESSVRRWMNYNTLLLLGLLAAVGGSTYLMCMRAGAETVHTDPTVVKATTTITTFLNGGAQNLRQMMVMLHETENVVKQFDAYPSATQIPLSDLHTNPFQSSVLPSDSAPVALSDDAQQREEEQQREAAQTVLNGLKLESVVCGSHSMCMISGKTYSEGQGNSDFTVEAITPDGVWVQVGSVRRELKMTPPKLD
jgi:hypothetical protein